MAVGHVCLPWEPPATEDDNIVASPKPEPDNCGCCLLL